MSRTNATPVLLVADIGGTFARFRLVQGKRTLTDVLTLPRASAGSLPCLCTLALRQFRQAVDGVAIAVAAPISAGRACMTNVGWEVDEASLADALKLERVLLINDFAALALSLPDLDDKDVLTIPPGPANGPPTGAAPAHSPQVVFGPGTGLGVSVLLHIDGRLQPIPSEGGHISFAPSSAFEQKVLEHAAAQFERVSWERILSGPGLELIDTVSRRDLDGPAEPRNAQQIIAAAQAGACRAAIHSVNCFAGLLGGFGGDLALMFRADGGVVISGGVTARIAGLVSLPAIRQRFSRKGRFSAWLDGLPLSILNNPNAALLGAARAFGERFPEASGTVKEINKQT
jgi:glucokinase